MHSPVDRFFVPPPFRFLDEDHGVHVPHTAEAAAADAEHARQLAARHVADPPVTVDGQYPILDAFVSEKQKRARVQPR